ncbi:hypothetical protein FBEOM_2079 [Fusarium beomiforme]|uniref:Uncharacterized protein n=1 Tax=Fusarium beomiforme TaxID=44412 RepID=A0A9P5AUA3_9HYPO|nr:hypothetical protein FBEOM_2079 [Fusarium beomiforme]
MGTKRRAARSAEPDHQQKKMKSDHYNSDSDSSSPADWEAMPPLKQAAGYVFIETTDQFDLLGLINAMNSDGPEPPTFIYKPPIVSIIVGHDTHSAAPTYLIEEKIH